MAFLGFILFKGAKEAKLQGGSIIEQGLVESSLALSCCYLGFPEDDSVHKLLDSCRSRRWVG